MTIQRPAQLSTLGNDGLPTSYLIFATIGRSTVYCHEIDYLGIGVTGNSRAECLETWLDEYKDETGNEYTPSRPQQPTLFN